VQKHVIYFPNCKINLGLSITEKRFDGFHNIETVMVPLPLTDILEVIGFNNHKMEFHQTGIELDSAHEDNLVIKAYKLMQQKFCLEPVKIHLHKVIPAGAGLGGGSSDATFMISALNDLFELQLPKEKLLELAGKIGSDCPFFIENRPVLATARGTVFSTAPLDLSNYFIVLVKPNIHIPTKDAYSWITPKIKDRSLIEIISEPIETWKENLINDFEIPLFERYPTLREVKENLYNAGAVYASMTGSGAAVYGIFDHQVNLKDQFEGCFYWQGGWKDLVLD
jgi:4-diphosphocytidyl-2-C-methyl-D-erythritol kinase